MLEKFFKKQKRPSEEPGEKPLNHYRTYVYYHIRTVLEDGKLYDTYGIIIDTVNFTSISTDDETQAAIQKKVNAQQELELANIEAKTAKVQADKDKEVALIAAEQEKERAAIQAEQAKIDAEGKAEAIKIKAEAEAEANRKIAESLTPELIEKQKIDKWNGEVPKIQGSNTSTIVDTRDMTADDNVE